MTAGSDFQTRLLELTPKIRATARSLCRDSALAEDLAQDTVERALRAQLKFKAGTNLKAWVLMILHNQFKSHKRRSWRSTQLDPSVAEGMLVAVTNPAAGLELDELRRALSMLAPNEREALVLICAGGFSYEEVSCKMGVPVGTIKSRMGRARVRLASIYDRGAIISGGKDPARAMSWLLEDIARHAAGDAIGPPSGNAPHRYRRSGQGDSGAAARS